MTEKIILINQIITDLGIIKESVNEQGFCDVKEIEGLIRKAEDVKEMEDREVIEKEAEENDPPEEEQ